MPGTFQRPIKYTYLINGHSDSAEQCATVYPYGLPIVVGGELLSDLNHFRSRIGFSGMAELTGGWTAALHAGNFCTHQERNLLRPRRRAHVTVASHDSVSWKGTFGWHSIGRLDDCHDTC